MAKEPFFQDVRRAWTFWHFRFRAEWVESTTQPQLLKPIWLLESTVSRYRQRDFLELDRETLSKLDSAVAEFRSFAKRTRDRDVDDEERVEGERLFAHLTDQVRAVVLHEWRTEVESLIDDAVQWSTSRGWLSRRETKTLSESLLGEHVLPRVLIYADVAHVLLEPISRFVPGAFGVAELTLIPSYESIKVPRTSKGWEVRLPSRPGFDDEKLMPWSRETFEGAVGFLTSSPV